MPRSWRKICGPSISAASVIAAGSVMKEPISGTKARHSQTRATGVRTGQARAISAINARIVSSTGFDAATTMMTNTNSGSV
jgi:hypothetical protein